MTIKRYHQPTARIKSGQGEVTNTTATAENKSAPNEKSYRHLFHQAPFASLLVSRDGCIQEFNQRAAELLRIKPETQTRHTLFDFSPPEDQKIFRDYLANVFLERQQQKLDIEMSTAHDRRIFARIISRPLDTEHDICQVTIMDQSNQASDHQMLNHLAYYDHLTGLPNRLLFSDHLHWAIRDARRQNERLAIMVIDLDNFKQVNDTLGHDAGDQLLQAVAARMNTCLREADTLSRMGGDEFTALMLHVSDQQDAAAAADRLLTAISQPLEIQNRNLAVSASIGICLYPEDGDTADQLIRNADIAMYRSKSRKRGSISFFSKSLKEDMSRKSDMEYRLRQALQAQELEVFYQPVVEAATCRIVGLEALLRWRTHDDGIMAAGKFLPLAEQLGLGCTYEDWALQKACLQMKDWLDRGVIKNTNSCKMAVNLSASQLEQPDLASGIGSILQTAGLPAQSFAVEVSETTFIMGSKITFQNLHNLRQQGIALHLDDFSQGFGTLQMINKIPFDCLKIDQACTSVFLENKQGEALLDALLSLSHVLGLRVIAEGVENQQAYSWLKEHACDEMQGYYFCRPISAVKMEMLLRIPQSS